MKIVFTESLSYWKDYWRKKYSRKNFASLAEDTGNQNSHLHFRDFFKQGSDNLTACTENPKITGSKSLSTSFVVIYFQTRVSIIQCKII